MRLSKKRGGIGGAVGGVATTDRGVDFVPYKFIDLAPIILKIPNDTRPHIELKIKSRSITGLLDSGATVSILGKGSEDLIQELKLRRYKMSTSVAVADGSKHLCTEYVNAPFNFNGKTKSIPTLVMPTIAMPLILGIDFWDAFQISPTVSENFIDSISVEKTSPVYEAHDLTVEQSEKLVEAIKLFPFASGDNDEELTFTNMMTHKIELEEGTVPVRQKQYIMSPYVQENVHREIERLLRLGIITKVENPEWLNPIIAVPKSDGRLRIVLDARELNKRTKRTAHPTQNIDRILGQLRGTKYLTAIDLSDAYHQVKLAEESVRLTSFYVPGMGVFAYTRMVQGCINSASALCELIDFLMSAELEPDAFPYLDDIVCATNDFNRHIAVLRRLAEILSKANLKISPTKSRFCMKRLRFLGYVLSEEGISADPERIRPIIEYPRPKTVKEVRRLIGMASWYRRFINDFSKLTVPITNLLKKNVKFVWTEEAEQAFEKLKVCLSSPPVLATARYDLPFEIQCDASATGAGSILTQIHEDGKERVVAFYSHKFTKAQQNFSTTERECLSCILAIERFRCFVEGTRFTVYTDHASLLWLKNIKDPTGRLSRWALKLQAYDFELKHRKGRYNVVPDAMSRVYEAMMINFATIENTSDEEYVELREEIRTNPISYPNFRVENNLVYKLCAKGRDAEVPIWKIFVPKDFRRHILVENHDEPLAAHGGFFKTVKRIQKRFYWPKMAEEITKYVRGCEVCQAVKPNTQIQRAPMGKQIRSDKPFRVISIDYQGPFPRSKAGNKWLLVIVDQLTKYTILHPMKAATANATEKFLGPNIFRRFGTPQYLLLDNGGQLRADDFKNMLEYYAIKPWYISPAHPQSNPVEATNSTIKNAIKSYIKGNTHHQEWDQNLIDIECAVNTSEHTQAGATPYSILYGCEMNTSGDEYKYVTDMNPSGITRDFKKIRERVQVCLKKAYDASKKRYDLRTRPINYNVGDIVWRKNFKLSSAVKNFAKKLAPRYIKCVVKEKIGTNTYRLADIGSGKILGDYNAVDIKMNYEE